MKLRHHPGGGSPPDGNELYNFKTKQSIRKAIFFQKIDDFFSLENFIFVGNKTFFSQATKEHQNS